MVDALQRTAEVKFREQEAELQQRLAATEQQLASLQQSDDPAQSPQLTPEQQATLQEFMAEKVRIRKELRDVRFQLNADIDALGRSLKLVNIALVPLLLTVGVLLLWFWRRRKR